MILQEIIRKKRDGHKLTSTDINAFITAVSAKTATEGQIAAFCMAVLLKKMDEDERVALTYAMAKSGTIMDWSTEHLPGPILDKHSTGGIGDKVSLMIAPIIAACGGFVPMIAGRGLGHTGGTLDKMDAIPGYQSQPDVALFKKTVREVGCAVIGATPDLAPADRIIYSIRDATGTVESLDLITASIISKKLAAGLQGLVMDVKFGTGAFMQNYDDSRALAESLVKIANGAGLPTVALLTDMNQPLGYTAGNALEVKEAIDYLKNQNIEPRMHELTVALTAEMLVLGKLAKDMTDARIQIDVVLRNGKAAEHFARMIKQLGGPADLMEKPDNYLNAAPVIKDFYAPTKGIVTGMDTRAIGIGIIELGGGRTKNTDVIDHSVGLTNIAHIGDDISGKPLATIHARDEASFLRMANRLTAAITIGANASKQILVKTRVTI